MKKRMLVIADMHCGHEYGARDDMHIRRWIRIHKNCTDISEVQEERWNWLKKNIDRYKPYDICLVNGDSIDGKGEMTGGREEIEHSLMDQAEIATNILKYIKAKKYIHTVGTAYHTGKNEDFERIVANDLGTELEDNKVFGVNGRFFDVRHFVTNASSPVSNKAIAIKKDQIFAALNSYHLEIEGNKEITVKPSFYIRSHVHKYDMATGSTYRIKLITTPCLQMRSFYGDRVCNGLVDYGFLIFDIDTKGEVSCKECIQQIQIHSPVETF